MYVHRIKRAAEALGIRVPKNSRSKLVKIIVAMVSIAGLGLNVGLANAASLTSASVALSDPRPSQALVTYSFTGSTVTNATAIKCVKVIFSTTSAGNTAPTGFSGASTDTTGFGASTLVGSSATNWSLVKTDGTGSTGQNNILTYTNSAAGSTPAGTTGQTFVIPKITNSSVPDVSYFMSLNTFSDTGCSAGIDTSVVKFINTNGSTLSLSVDPTLTFTVNPVAASTACDGTTTTAASTSTTIPFGSVSTASNAIVCQDLTASTNATNGYTVYTRYTAAPTNGLGQAIADWTGTNAAPTTFPGAGTEAYGYTTNSATLGTGTANRFTNPGQNWAKETTTNAEVGYTATGVTSTTYRIGHQVGVSLTTKPGTYQTTVIYTCTPIY